MYLELKNYEVSNGLEKKKEKEIYTHPTHIQREKTNMEKC